MTAVLGLPGRIELSLCLLGGGTNCDAARCSNENRYIYIWNFEGLWGALLREMECLSRSASDLEREKKDVFLCIIMEGRQVDAQLMTREYIYKRSV